MNDVFHEYLDGFVVYYIDDILISPKTWNSTNDMFDLFWTSLGKSKLYAKLEKCEFHQIEMEFFDYIIFGDGICMDSWKV
jgi:hypothetical protein